MKSLAVVALLWMIRQRWFETYVAVHSKRLDAWVGSKCALSLRDVSSLSCVVMVPFWETALMTRMSVNWSLWAPNVVHEVSLMDAMNAAFVVAGVCVAVLVALRRADRIAAYYTVAVVAPLLIVLFALAIASAAKPSTSITVWLALTLFSASAVAVVGLLRAALVYGPRAARA
jgi:hypothetical protein